MRIMTWIVAMALVGCSLPDQQVASSDDRYTLRHSETGHVYFVIEFKLKDGTRCVALDDGGITCDWKSKPEAEKSEH